MISDEIMDRMKRYETVTRFYLTPRTYLILRLDGRSFHTFTRNCERPYDQLLADAMDVAAQALAKDAMGCRLAYLQSDECSFLLTDFETHESEMWFGGNIQKIASVAASMFTAHFNQNWQTSHPGSSLATFDARVFIIPNRIEVENYLIARQEDAARNSLNLLASHYFSHKQLHGKSSSDRHEMLHGIDVNWAGYPAHQKHGRVVRKNIRDRNVAYIHKKTGKLIEEIVQESYWETDQNIPKFTSDRTYLDALMPIQD